MVHNSDVDFKQSAAGETGIADFSTTSCYSL